MIAAAACLRTEYLTGRGRVVSVLTYAFVSHFSLPPSASARTFAARSSKLSATRLSA